MSSDAAAEDGGSAHAETGAAPTSPAAADGGGADETVDDPAAPTPDAATGEDDGLADKGADPVQETAPAEEGAHPDAEASTDAPTAPPGEHSAEAAAHDTSAPSDDPASPAADAVAAPDVEAAADDSDPTASPADASAPMAGEVTAPDERCAAPEGESDAPAEPGAQAERLDVPDTHLEICSEAQMDGDGKARATVDRLQAALEGLVAECGSDFVALPDGDLRDELIAWQSKLASHASELKGIVEKERSPSAAEAAHSAVEEDLLGDLEGMRDMRLQLEADRTGRNVEDVASAWSDPAETEREIQELRRARRQIRSLFGGMVGSLGDLHNLRIDDLVSNYDETPRQDPLPLAQQQVIGSGGGYGSTELPRKGIEVGTGGAGPSTPGRPPQMPGQAKNKDAAFVPHPPAGAKVPGHSPRPRSGGTVRSSVTNSSADTWGSQNLHQADDEERRRERRERKERKERKHRENSERRKKDDGAAPKQWNWANEVVQASMDPHNQWEFPVAGARHAAKARVGDAEEIKLWEQPRQHHQRGGDVASRARERAQEVLRAEREQQQRLIFGGEAMRPYD